MVGKIKLDLVFITKQESGCIQLKTPKRNHWIIDFPRLKYIPGFWCIFCAKQLYRPSNKELAISNLEISEGNGSSKPLNYIKNVITVVTIIPESYCKPEICENEQQCRRTEIMLRDLKRGSQDEVCRKRRRTWTEAGRSVGRWRCRDLQAF